LLADPLVALFEHLVQRQPEIEAVLELLVELPLSVTSSQEKRSRERTIDPAAIKSQVDVAFDRAGTDWDAAGRAAFDLEQVCVIGHDFAQAGAWANAQVVYATLAEEILSQYHLFRDEGQLSWVLSECADGLLACLKVQSDLPQNERLDANGREDLLTSLFALWHFGDHSGGIKSDLAHTIGELATAHERTLLETWLREKLQLAPIEKQRSERGEKYMEKNEWTIGESVVVKSGVTDPDTGRDLGGWQGRIGAIFEEERTVTIHWDRLTLESLPLAHIAWCEEEGLDWSAMSLSGEEILPVPARDTEAEVVQARTRLESQLIAPFAATVTEEQRGPVRQGAQVTVLRIVDLDDLYGTLVEVQSKQRISTLPLCDLKATKAETSTQELVDDYSMWFANR
jgi:hypothetical protein